MNGIAIVILLFSLLGAIDYLIGNKIGVGREFERAFSLFCPMALSMLGMIVIAPAIGVLLEPVFSLFYRVLHLDPSILPASVFANDMGGAPLAQSIAKSQEIGGYNAFVISSMMGCVISFTIPFSLGIVNKSQRKELFFGFLCGIVTIPIGGFFAGLICGISPLLVLLDLLPLILLALMLGVALIFLEQYCIRAFEIFGAVMKILGIVGLGIAVFAFLAKVQISPHLDTFENAAMVCASACVTLSGALPLMFLLTKLLNKPLTYLSEKIGINGVSALAFLGTLVTNASTFGMMERMDKRGVVLNAAFAVSASFVFGSHLAFTMAYDGRYILPMIVGKLISGICAVVLAAILYHEKTIDLSNRQEERVLCVKQGDSK